MSSGSIQVVGLGPGDSSLMAPSARAAIESADVILGYKTYLNLIADLAPETPRQSSGMRKEVERAQEALTLAQDGKRVIVVSSGDAGVYGMAGLLFEISHENEFDVDIEVIPGISALNAAAALLGAPLMTDFAAISLSDQLVPLEQIATRLEAVARTDFVLCLYNPKGKRRVEPFQIACQIMLKHRDPQTPVGVVRKAYRPGQKVSIVHLEELPACDIDMLTILIVGNQDTYAKNGKLITPRGYADKYTY